MKRRCEDQAEEQDAPELSADAGNLQDVEGSVRGYFPKTIYLFTAKITNATEPIIAFCPIQFFETSRTKSPAVNIHLPPLRCVEFNDLRSQPSAVFLSENIIHPPLLSD